MSANEPTRSVLVVGDIINDEYIHVQTTRQAAEAPIPVWDEVRRESRCGGAWNVAANIAAMDPTLEVYLAGILDVQKWSRAKGVNCSKFCFGGPELTKTRYVDNGKIIFRHDDQLKVDETDADLMLDKLHGYKSVFDAVVYSDYNKGTLTSGVISYCNDLARLIIVDSKRKDLRMFARNEPDEDAPNAMTILKINEEEWGMHAADEVPVEALFNFVVVTKGKEGAALRQYDQARSSALRRITHEEHFPTKKTWAVDVTGCGDTHTAGMTVALLNGADVRQAVRFANEKAYQAVKIFGTAVVS